jgi:formamidopyrimidine-DNA glycosylase
MHAVRGARNLRQHDPGGLEVIDATLEQFRSAITRENHTLKRSLTDPRVVLAIGNAYSDEILHHARLSPLTLAHRLLDDDIARLFDSIRTVLLGWRDRLIRETGDRFPEKVTAFRDGMAVHGRFGLPCPDCGTKVQRIRYADNETNYCPRCQTGGKVLRDRPLSRLLQDDWPASIDDWE